MNRNSTLSGCWACLFGLLYIAGCTAGELGDAGEGGDGGSGPSASGAGSNMGGGGSIPDGGTGGMSRAVGATASSAASSVSTSSGAGGGGQAHIDCAPLPEAAGTIVTVTSADAGTLASIVSAATSGTTIILEDGIYALSAPLHFTTDDVTLRSASNDPTSVIIDGQYQVNEIAVVSASHVTLAHITIRRAIDHPVHVYPPGPGVFVKNTLLYGLRLLDAGEQFVKINPIGGQDGYVDDGRIECSFFGLSDEGRTHVETCCGGCYTGGIDAHAAWNWTVRNNRFENIYCAGTGLAEHAVHFWKGSRDTLVENNIILNCARGIGFGLSGGQGERVYADAPHDGANLAHYDGIIRNNIIYADVPWYDTGIELHDTRRPTVVHNTVVSGAGATGLFSGIDYRFPQTAVTLKNNLTDSITVRDGASGTLEANLEAPSMAWFVDPTRRDFHLGPNATQAIDKGVEVDEAGLDIDGDAHGLGAAPDIGADESVP